MSTATEIRPFHVEIPEKQIDAVADVILTAAAAVDRTPAR